MWLIAINVGIYILQLVTRGTVAYDDLGYPSPGSSPVTDWLILDTSKVLHGQVWRLLTGAFLHDPNSLTHIFFNMLFLWWFGHEVENIYGGKEFLAFYLAAAVIGNVAYVAWQLVTGDRTPALGASGAVSAAMVLFAMHLPLLHPAFLVRPGSIWLFVVLRWAGPYVFSRIPTPWWRDGTPRRRGVRLPVLSPAVARAELGARFLRRAAHANSAQAPRLPRRGRRTRTNAGRCARRRRAVRR